ncbi:TonB-dependent receptor domain-containing protein, partial [Staphylococcus aureus]
AGDLPTRRRVAGGASATIGVFADASRESGPLTLSLGGRLDHWDITGGALAETSLAPGPVLTDSHFPDRRGWEATGRAGAAYRLGGVTLRAAA